MNNRKYKYGCLIVCRNEKDWIQYTLNMVQRHVDVVAIVRGLTSWREGLTNLDNTDLLISKYVADNDATNIVYEEWGKPTSDEAHRNRCLDILKKKECDFVWIVDCDEFYHERDIEQLIAFCEKNGPEVVGNVYIYALAYWKGFSHLCGSERFGPVIASIRKDTHFSYIRNIDQDQQFTLNLFLHHMTAVKTDEMMAEKIKSWSHSHEVVKDWFLKKWKAWDTNRSITNLHPVSPVLWPGVMEIDKYGLPEILHSHPWFRRDVVR